MVWVELAHDTHDMGNALTIDFHEDLGGCFKALVKDW